MAVRWQVLHPLHGEEVLLEEDDEDLVIGAALN